ncbi:MAG TPA: hypothetical protein VEC93_10865, partial [Anaerolineae bacterium]|nr:hypothetical protein [Anaerolineae bacterium]
QHPQPDTLWPDYAASRPPQKIDPATLPPDATIKTIAHRSESDEFLIDTPREFSASIRTLYWPGWQVYLDGQPATFTITKPAGLIQTVIPAGQHTLTLRLQSTSLRTAGLLLTTLSFIIFTIIGAFALKQRLSKLANRQTDNRKQQLTTSHIPHPTSHIPHLTSPVSAQFFTLATALLFILYLLSRQLAPWFTLQSNPDRPQPADQILQADFGRSAEQSPRLRLVGRDKLPPTVLVTPNETTNLTATLYWRALQELDTNYSVFLHLDAPNGQTFATVDEVHPENIPTRNWPPGLYLRNPLHLEIPANLPPIRYELNAGWYDRQNDERLVILPGNATSFNLGSIWLIPPQPALPQQPLAHFGPHITLWQSDYSSTDHHTLTLHWQTNQLIDQNYSIFIHLLDADGKLLAQADGAPYADLYPLTHWQPGQIITDSRQFASLLPHPADLAAIAIGIYNSTTGERLAATDANNQPLPHNSFIMPVTP